ncbi:hypothetical protein QVD17_37490 [Tagetes erecta]|uniref:Uncharacterized protein n=1 Tax=Tagetes erecta TaxID=13708 RepID=A0AAD8JUP8_TARER|nr:hypothetical protein QVD17_37490 [Tagetes erecta]
MDNGWVRPLCGHRLTSMRSQWNLGPFCKTQTNLNSPFATESRLTNSFSKDTESRLSCSLQIPNLLRHHSSRFSIIHICLIVKSIK